MMFASAADALGSHYDERWLLIAATARAQGERCLERHGIKPSLVLDRHDLVRSPRRLRRLLTRQSIDRVALHSADWSRQRTPQLFALAVCALAGYPCYRIDQRAQEVRLVSCAERVGDLARTPVDLLEGAIRASAQVTRLLMHRPTAREAARRDIGEPPGAVLAIWLGDPGTDVGGSVTHISGILGGFRRCGMRVGLVTMHDPPSQLTEVVDDLEIAPPAGRGARIIKEAEWIAANRLLGSAGMKLSQRLKPDFVYQRHHPFVCAGADLVREQRLPLVLEWNGSEAWFRRWYESTHAMRVFGGRAVTGLLATLERRVVADATLIAAVSEHARDGACAIGADPQAVLVVPNAVDVAEVRRAASRPDDSLCGHAMGGNATSVGWIGSFGAWHGAEVLIRAASHLPDTIQVVMIGDGPERSSCEQLAAELDVSKRIVFLGTRDHSAALRCLAACDMLASPHVPFRADEPFFGSPTKLFEYMALGKPIVASRLEQLGQLLDDGRTARLVTPGDPDELARTIVEVTESSDHGDALGRAARQEAEAMHDWRHRASTIVERLDEMRTRSSQVPMVVA